MIRNVCTFIAADPKCREIVREFKLIPLLLEHLESSSLTVVGNACVILSKLSSSSTVPDHENDLRTMIELNATKKLAQLKNSKHQTIRDGAWITYKNLINSQSYANLSIFEGNF